MKCSMELEYGVPCLSSSDIFIHSLPALDHTHTHRLMHKLLLIDGLTSEAQHVALWLKLCKHGWLHTHTQTKGTHTHKKSYLEKFLS